MGMFVMVTALQHDSPSVQRQLLADFIPLNSGNWIALLPKAVIQLLLR